MKIGVFGSDGKSSIIKILNHLLYDEEIELIELNNEINEYFDYLIFTNYTYQYKLDVFYFINNLKGTLIYNNDDYYSKLFNVNSSISYGLENADIKAINIIKKPTKTTFDLVINNKIYNDFSVNLIGTFNIYNILACIPICLIYKDIETIKKRLRIMPKIEGLCDVSYKKNILYIKDFSHTPNSVFEVISNALLLTKNNLIVIADIKCNNTNIINSIISCFSDFVIFTNDKNKYIKKENYIIMPSNKAIDLAFKIANYNDTILHFKY